MLSRSSCSAVAAQLLLVAAEHAALAANGALRHDTMRHARLEQMMLAPLSSAYCCLHSVWIGCWSKHHGPREPHGACCGWMAVVRDRLVSLRRRWLGDADDSDTDSQHSGGGGKSKWGGGKESKWGAIPLCIPLYHTTPKQSKNRSNTGMIPVNLPHCLSRPSRRASLLRAALE